MDQDHYKLDKPNAPPSFKNWHLKVSITGVQKAVKWWNDRKVKKKKGNLVWVYDGCDCIPEEGYRSVPYCEDHFNPLIRVEVE
jgi:hypothetical protein